MKKKIDFKQTHFVIPIIVLPFIFILYYIFFRETGVEPSLPQQELQGFNTELPNAKKDLETPDRLQAYQDAVKKRRMVSGMSNLDEEDGRAKLIKEGQAAKDSLERVFKEKERMNLRKSKGDAAKAHRNEAIAAAKASKDALMKIRNKSLARQGEKGTNGLTGVSEASTNNSQNGSVPQTKETKEMEAFKSQMRYLDSMQNPQKYLAEAAAIEEAKRVLDNPINKISKTNNTNTDSNYFNTIKADLGKTMITAILDEGIKAWEGSRVRIRLLEPIFIDGRLLDKGQYLFGIVTGFSNQRLEIDISSVVIQDEIIPMQVTLYDNDGIKGIYIPASSFRTFSKELGSKSSQASINMNEAPDNNSQALYQSITSAVQSSSQALQKALRKNKATLKYNTQVFLVNTAN